MIVLFANDKGGVGKTTNAVNMAVMRMLAGHDVLLADCDQQRTASNWCSLRSTIEPPVKSFQRVQLTGADVAQELVNLSTRYGDVIIDTHGSDSVEMRQAMTIADVVVMPLQASQFDLWGVSRMMQVVRNIEATWPAGQKMNLKAMITCANPKGQKDIQELRETLQQSNIPLMNTTVFSRLIYSRMGKLGLAIVESKRKADPKGMAVEEMKGVYKEIFGEDWRVE